MTKPSHTPQSRSEVRPQLLRRARAVALDHGATALHVLGSVARSVDDEFSDLDLWLTFPDAKTVVANQNRRNLFGAVGDMLISHEAAPNRPVGGAYTLVVYQTCVGPMQIDWYLSPLSTSRVAHDALTSFEAVSVARGEWQLDRAARSEQSLHERVDFLICMLFISVKKVLRGRDREFEVFLARSCGEVGQQYGLGDFPVGNPDSLGAIQAMLRQLGKHANLSQRRAIFAIDAYIDSVLG